MRRAEGEISGCRREVGQAACLLDTCKGDPQTPQENADNSTSRQMGSKAALKTLPGAERDAEAEESL